MPMFSNQMFRKQIRVWMMLWSGIHLHLVISLSLVNSTFAFTHNFCIHLQMLSETSYTLSSLS